MEREIVKVLDEGKLTVIEAHKKLCAIMDGKYTEKDMETAYDKGFQDGVHFESNQKST